MKEIISLAKFILSENVQRPATIWDFPPDGWQKTSVLLKGILEEKVQDDATAIALLYGEEKPGNKYEKLKSRTRDQLYNAVLFLKPEMLSETSRAYVYCSKHYVIASMLFSLGQRGPAMDMLKKVFRVAGKHGQHVMRMLSADLLQTYASLEGNAREFDFYREESATANRLYWQHKTLEALYSDWVIHFARKAFPDKEVIEKCRMAYEHSSDMFKEDKSVKTAMFYYLNKISYLQITGKNEAALRGCDEYENYLLSLKEGYTKKYLGIIQLQRLDLLLQMGEFHLAEEYADQALKIFTAHSDNWLQAFKLYFLLCLNFQQIEKLMNLTLMLRLKDYSPQQQDDIKLLRGYFFLELAFAGQTDKINRLNGGKSFKPMRLLNDIKTINKDKAGYNISALVLEAMFYVIDGDAVRLLERTDAYRVYLYRHTLAPWQKRANIFLKILYKLAKCGMDGTYFRKKAARDIQQLQKSHSQYFTNAALAEIISYERLLEMILAVI